MLAVMSAVALIRPSDRGLGVSLSEFTRLAYWKTRPEKRSERTQKVSICSNQSVTTKKQKSRGLLDIIDVVGG